jgi:hypothetical protein
VPMKGFKPTRATGLPKSSKLAALAVVVALIVGFSIYAAFLATGHRRPVATSACAMPSSSRSSAPPRPGGYCQLVPAGRFASLPSDTQAAAAVHYSSWEPRPQNDAANHRVPSPRFTTAGVTGAYGLVHRRELFGRITGAFTGTTDEIIQWVAAKWGLPDELIRAQAVQESNWYQDLKDVREQPISGDGYGDFGSCNGRGSPSPSGYGKSGPSSFGLMQDKWCVFQNGAAGANHYGGWPWTELSTAYSIEQYAAYVRGCFEGWNQWLGTVGPIRTDYHAGDLWGCVGSWYSGYWYDNGPIKSTPYIESVRHLFEAKPWLRWAG